MRISWTQVESFRRCSLQHHLRYTEKIRRPRDPKPFLVGDVVHTALHQWADARYSQTPSIRDRAVAVFKHKVANIFLSQEKLEELFNRAVTSAVRAAEIYEGLGFPSRRCVIEPRFTTRLSPSNHELNGGCDVYDPVRQAIFDLKNYSSTSELGSREQLLTYGIAMESRGMPVRGGAFIYPLRAEPVQSILFEPGELVEHRNRLIGLAETIPTTTPTPNPTFFCNWCEFYRTNFCPTTMRTPLDTEMTKSGSREVSFAQNTNQDSEGG